MARDPWRKEAYGQRLGLDKKPSSVGTDALDWSAQRSLPLNRSPSTSISSRIRGAMALFRPEVTISTPGKVLASGGYMVLQDGHAVVLSTTSRFYSNIKSTFSHKEGTSCSFHIKVLSPQFQKRWAYSASWDLSESQASDFKFAGIPEESDGNNVFVQFALFYGLAAAACLPQYSKISAGSYSLTVTLQADNDFYSHSKSVRLPFYHCYTLTASPTTL